MDITLYHNPRCAKSRQALALLEARGLQPKVVAYLKHPLTAKQVAALCKQLGGHAMDLVRRQEEAFAASGLEAIDNPSQSDICQAIATHPQLMQRPVVVCGTRAIIARPPEALEAFLSTT